MGEHTPYRVRVFGSGFQELCRRHQDLLPINNPSAATAASVPRSTKRSAPLKQQLGITRTELLQWALDEYAGEAEALLAEFRLPPTTGSSFHSLSKSKKLSNSVHHYAHALEFTDDPDNLALAQSLRTEVFELLYRDWENGKPENERVRRRTGRILEDWPEIMKSVAVAGSNILQFGTAEQRRRVAQRVMAVLLELRDLCHPVQRKAVMQMVGQTYSEIGMIDLSEDRITEASQNFLTHLEINRDLSSVIGEHILVNPMSMYANTLSMLARYNESIPLYQEVLKLVERHLGTEHDAVAQHLLNYGIALVQTKQYDEAKVLLQRALRLFDSRNVRTDKIVYVRTKEFLQMAIDRVSM